MNAPDRDEPMYGSIQEMLDAQKIENIRHAATGAREAIAWLQADGVKVAPGTEEALAWKILQKLNAGLPCAESIERDMQITAGSEPLLH